MPSAHLLSALPGFLAVPANLALLNLTVGANGPERSGPAFWMLDPYGGCVAASVTPGSAGEAGVLPAPCSSKLHYVCMESSVVEDLAEQVSARPCGYVCVCDCARMRVCAGGGGGCARGQRT